MTAVGCPRCRSTDLGTLENLLGTAGCRVRRIGGELEFVHDGWTDVDWDSSTSIGITCRSCSWEDSDKGWEHRLLHERKGT
jgi:hypothetical protein